MAGESPFEFTSRHSAKRHAHQAHTPRADRGARLQDTQAATTQRATALLRHPLSPSICPRREASAKWRQPKQPRLRGRGAPRGLRCQGRRAVAGKRPTTVHLLGLRALAPAEPTKVHPPNRRARGACGECKRRAKRSRRRKPGGGKATSRGHGTMQTRPIRRHGAGSTWRR